MRTLFLLAFAVGCTGSGTLEPTTGDAPPDFVPPTLSTETDTDVDTDTDTTEPPHEIDWSLCDIALTCEDNIWNEPKQNCDVRVTEGDGYVLYDGNGGLEIRGRSSLGWAKSAGPSSA